MKNKFLALTALAYFMAAPAFAAKPSAFKILPADSHIKFQATQGGAAINGEFKTFTADINFHPDALAESSVKVTIDTGSYNVDDNDAKGALKDKEWFDVKGFPQAVFEAKSFKSLGNKKYEAAGNLTIKGHSEPVVLSFILAEFSEKSAAIAGELVLKRRAFKIGEDSTDSVKDDVKVVVEVKAVGVR